MTPAWIPCWEMLISQCGVWPGHGHHCFACVVVVELLLFMSVRALQVILLLSWDSGGLHSLSHWFRNEKIEAPRQWLAHCEISHMETERSFWPSRPPLRPLSFRQPPDTLEIPNTVEDTPRRTLGSEDTWMSKCPPPANRRDMHSEGTRGAGRWTGKHWKGSQGIRLCPRCVSSLHLGAICTALKWGLWRTDHLQGASEY